MGRNWKAIDLNGSGPWKGSQREESKYATIKLTEKFRCMDGSIIVCRYVDHHWVFVRLRNDSDLPNGKNALEGNASFSFYYDFIIKLFCSLQRKIKGFEESCYSSSSARRFIGIAQSFTFLFIHLYVLFVHPEM